MGQGGPDQSEQLSVSRAAKRAVLGVGVVFILMQSLTVGAFISTKSASIESGQTQLRLDPNVAGREELMLLPGIGPALADAVIDFRGADPLRPAFRCAEDLDDVRRIGPMTVERLRPLLRFDSAGLRSEERAEETSP